MTEIKPFEAFYEAEPEHRNYYADNADARYCQLVIHPKLNKFRAQFAGRMKASGGADGA